MSTRCPVWYWWLNLRLRKCFWDPSKCEMTQWSNVGSAVRLWLYFRLVGLNCSIHCRGFLWFIFRKCKHGKLSVWLTLEIMSKIFSSLDMTTVLFLLSEGWPPDWEVACIIPVTHIEGNPGAVYWNSCLPFFFFFLKETRKKNQDKIEQQCAILEPPVHRPIVSTAFLIRHLISKLEQHLEILNMVEMS